MSIFKFKQFEVDQSGCAMKINTDGILLAAMAESNAPKHILDIGTGTGVLALMLAQRFPSAKVEAVEIDEQAALTAGRNFRNSIFSKQLSVRNIAIEQYNSSQKFDLIISNPPFFINDLKSTEEKKGIARHATEQFFEDLMAKVNEIITEEGRFWFVLPVKQAGLLIKNGLTFGFHVTKIIHLHSDKQKPVFRQIVCLSKLKTVQEDEHFYIYQEEKVYTDTYKVLLKDFFLGY